jgi:hypothetical protein
VLAIFVDLDTAAAVLHRAFCVTVDIAFDSALRVGAV